MIRKILLVLLIALIVIQFFRPEKNVSPGKQQLSISNAYPIPSDVAPILEKACYDCHTNNSRYPWYSKIQPVAWWLDNHIREGKSHLNLDEFLSYSAKKQDHKMEEVIETVKENVMPLDSYTWTHHDARLTQKEKETIVSWADQTRKMISDKTGFYPEKEKE